MATRTWSFASIPSAAAVSRASRRPAKTSGSLASSRPAELDGHRVPPHHQHRSIVPPGSRVAQQGGGDHRRRSPGESRDRGEVPAFLDAVAVHDEDGVVVDVKVDLTDRDGLVADDPRVRHQRPARSPRPMMKALMLPIPATLSRRKAGSIADDHGRRAPGVAEAVVQLAENRPGLGLVGVEEGGHRRL